MDNSKFSRLQEISIVTPCPEDWESMEGDEKRRFCSGCGCHVHNVAGMEAEEAEDALSGPGKICARIQVDPQKGVLTRSGWIPRLLLAGAVAATAAGCQTNTGEVNSAALSTASTTQESVEKKPVKTSSKTQVAKPEDSRMIAGLVAPSLRDEKLKDEKSVK